MNAAQAKQTIKIADFLASQGIKPTRIRGNAYWYRSPLRNEKTASFEVNTTRNIWHDHGTSEGGNLIDLVQRLFEVDVSGALDLLRESSAAKKSFFFHQQEASSQPSGITITNVRRLQNTALIKYVEGRGIPANIAGKYLNECYFKAASQVTKRNLFALGFKNDLGGYELRNSQFKGATSPKAITTVQGIDKSTVAVFEGFMDFLSAMVHYNRQQPTTDAIILNSIGNVGTALDRLRTYNKINLFLDNDSAGEGATNQILSTLPGVANYSKIIYPNHQDFNDFLTRT